MTSWAERTRDWLLANRAELDTPEHFFDVAWIRHKIVCIGERHYDAPHRDFVAGRVRHWGGPNIGLALEIASSQQGEIATFMRTGIVPTGRWFSRQPAFHNVLHAARETRTQVSAVDQEQKAIRNDSGVALSFGRTDRDAHMASAVTQLTHGKSKVLVLVGMEHAKEAGPVRSPPMGATLTRAFGKAVYTICTMTPAGHGDEAFFKAMRGAFGGRKAIAFDVDRSPLADAPVVDSGAALFTTWKDYCDGLILFFTD